MLLWFPDARPLENIGGLFINIFTGLSDYLGTWRQIPSRLDRNLNLVFNNLLELKNISIEFKNFDTPVAL